MSERTHHILSAFTEAEWHEVLREARHGTVLVVTLGEKAEKKGQYPAGTGFKVRKVPGRIYEVSRAD